MAKYNLLTYLPDVKFVAANDKTRCVHCFRQPSYHKQYFFCYKQRNAQNEIENQYSLSFLNLGKCCGTESTIIGISVMSHGYSGKFL